MWPTGSTTELAIDVKSKIRLSNVKDKTGRGNNYNITVRIMRQRAKTSIRAGPQIETKIVSLFFSFFVFFVFLFFISYSCFYFPVCFLDFGASISMRENFRSAWKFPFTRAHGMRDSNIINLIELKSNNAFSASQKTQISPFYRIAPSSR